jgi:hypothetical protein
LRSARGLTFGRTRPGLHSFDATSNWTMADLGKQSFMDAWNSLAFVNLREAHLRKDVRGTVCEKC